MVVLYLSYNRCTQDTQDTQTTCNSNSELFSDVKPKIKVYNFNTSWCGYSVRFQPEWNNFSDSVKLNNNNIDLSNVEAVDIKCDDPVNKQMCQDFQIAGFPSVVAVVNNKNIPYEGNRTAHDIIEFVSQL